ncbi:MAG: prepilin-type N-terminal cleavage/methylation domain-containing protein [Phycisphaeraceae bacterium]|nr:prepilin-type N-terminal cleavage/methylation domain-containing protein [Phycisphaeraceae bacterium]
MTRYPTPDTRYPNAAFSLVEVVVSMLIVSLLFTAALSAVAASRSTRVVMAEQARGCQLAGDLLSEIIDQDYADPVNGDGLTPNATELAAGNRSLFNDVDDYNGLSESPPADRNGTAIAGFDGWSRQVVITHVNPDNVSASANASQRAKLITVTVKHGDRVVTQLKAIRTWACSDLIRKGVLP